MEYKITTNSEQDTIVLAQNIESEKDYFLKLDIDRIHIFDKINERLICD